MKTRELSPHMEQSGLFDNPLQIFESVAHSSPNKTAMYFAGQEISFDFLNSSANILAKELIDRGIPQLDDAVCLVLANHGINAPLSLLACLKAQVIYAPVDPDFPAARIDTICSSLNPSVIICSSEHLEKLPSDLRVKAIIPQISGDKSIGNVKLPAPLSNKAAYIFFTSGSTGTPKGVVGSWGNLSNIVSLARTDFGFNAAMHLAAAAKPTFSVSFYEIFAPLCFGGTVSLLTRNEILDSDTLIAHITDCNTFHMTPALLRNLLEAIKSKSIDHNNFDHINRIYTGGDFIPTTLIDDVGQYFKHAKIWTIWGCSEIAAFGSRAIISPPFNEQRVHVGQPCSNNTILICDEKGNSLPTNQKGEVLVSGPGTTPIGYWNDEKKTRERFLEREGELFYSTGDIGYIDQNENLHILGRSDFQVQINGIRVELPEIESVIRQVDGILDVAVMSFQDERGTLKVYGFLVGKIDESTLYSIQQKLGVSLPEYMHPHGFVKLDRLPTNLNGKIDRLALKMPAHKDLIFVTANDVPETGTERILLGLWKKEFGFNEIGVSSNFFSLGGDSLKATKLLSQINDTFDSNLSIAGFMSNPTIKSMANAIDKHFALREKEENCIILRRGEGAPLFCIYGVLLYKELADAIAVNCPVYGVYLNEEQDLVEANDIKLAIEKLKSVENIAQMYVDTIRKVQPSGPYKIAGFSFGGLIALEAARILERDSETVDFLGLIDSWSPKFERKSFHSKLLSRFRRLVIHPERTYIKYRDSLLFYKRWTAPPKNEPQEKQHDLREEARAYFSKNYELRHYSNPVTLYTASKCEIGDPTDKTLGWRGYIENLDIVQVEGRHHEVLDSPNVKTIADDIFGKIHSQ